MWELWGVEISAFPLTWHIAYTTACCYHTSRDNTCFRAWRKISRRSAERPRRFRVEKKECSKT